MSWTETASLSFSARHETSQVDAALAVLEALEAHRTRLEELFPQVPSNVTVVLHDSPLQLALAHPQLLLARRLASPAARRYMAGWYTTSEVHSLAPQVLRRLAAGPDSLKALALTPERVYTLLVVGTNSPLLPPPFRPAAFARLLRLAWLADGAAQFLAGQVPHLRAALARRLRGRPPDLPPRPRDAALLAGSVYDLLERERGLEACVRLALSDEIKPPERMIEQAFGSPYADVRLRWRAHLEELARAQPAVTLDEPPGAEPPPSARR
jgi:hypothetical protein